MATKLEWWFSKWSLARQILIFQLVFGVLGWILLFNHWWSFLPMVVLTVIGTWFHKRRLNHVYGHEFNDFTKRPVSDWIRASPLMGVWWIWGYQDLYSLHLRLKNRAMLEGKK